MNRLFEVPRADTLAEIVAKYPRATAKDLAMAEKAEKKRRQILKEKIKDPLLLMVTIKDLELSKGFSNVHLALSVDTRRTVVPV